VTEFEDGPRFPVGRPRKVTTELADRCDALRREGLSWSQIALRTGLNAETARKAVRLIRRRVLDAPREPLPTEMVLAGGGRT
jgi:hypothetical protein